MIREQWYVVLDSTQVGRHPIGVTRMGEKLVFWRDEAGKVGCLQDRCVHRGAELSAGDVVDGHLQCPFHGFEYDPSGRVRVIPANGRQSPVPERFRVRGYPTHEREGLIWIWWGEDPSEDLEPPAFFDDLGEWFSYGSICDPWDAHYSRVIENQLDVVHLPFVHESTIGRGGRTLVDGPLVEWVDPNRFYVYVFNRVDDGTPPRKPHELTKPDDGFHLEFIFPNLWQNHISDQTRVVAAFVPVDEAHTLLYLRFYQSIVLIPLVRDVFNRLAMPFNRLIAHQDRRVVQTQRPRPSGLTIGEKLIQGDGPIIEYRKRRRELKQQTGASTAR